MRTLFFATFFFFTSILLHIGPMCAVCDPDGYYLDAETSTCVQCASNEKGKGGWRFSFTPSVIVFIIVVAFALAVALVFALLEICGDDAIYKNATTENSRTSPQVLKAIFKQKMLAALVRSNEIISFKGMLIALNDYVYVCLQGCSTAKSNNKKLKYALAKIGEFPGVAVSQPQVSTDDDDGAFTVEATFKNEDLKTTRVIKEEKVTSAAVFKTTTTTTTTVSRAIMKVSKEVCPCPLSP
jgi:hypothetical protein